MHPWPAASSLRGQRVSAPEESLPEQSPWGPCQPPDLGSPAPQPLGPVARAGLCCSLGSQPPGCQEGRGWAILPFYQGEKPSIPLRTTQARRMALVLIFVLGCLPPHLCLSVSLCAFTAGTLGWGAGMDSGT